MARFSALFIMVGLLSISTAQAVNPMYRHERFSVRGGGKVKN
jgi:hypothetical protein